MDVTAAELLHANPALNWKLLKIGEKIFIPSKVVEQREAPPQKNG